MMIHKIVRYKVKAEKLLQVQEAIRTFVAAISRDEPHTNYVAYATSDPTVFVHTMLFPDEAAENYHQNAVHTQAFVSALYPNCDEEPVFTTLAPFAATAGD